jgi:catechol 2,3-dioxygenase-like lactoylglutathione lyase family enzyme
VSAALCPKGRADSRKPSSQSSERRKRIANWYARPVLAVRDATAALDFYSRKLGFREDWRYDEGGRLRIVQVSRAGCENILSDQWPEEAGRGLLFISLDQADFDRLLSDSIERTFELKSGSWGYELAIVQDPDGNRLWFPKPSTER